MRTLMTRLALAGALLALAAPAVHAEPPGTFDRGFGHEGLATAEPLHHGNATVVTSLPDNRLLMAAVCDSRDNTDAVGVARFRPDGAPDHAFGGGDGAVCVHVRKRTDGVNVSRPTSMIVQDDGKILVGGEAESIYDYGGQQHVETYAILVRFLPDGELDTSFGAGGEVIQAVGYYASGGISPAFTALVEDDQQRITTLGTVKVTENAPTTLAELRFLPDGSLDSSFGTNGMVSQSISGLGFVNEVMHGVADAAGRIVFVADDLDVSVVGRLNPDGQLDSAFGGGDGVVQVPKVGGSTTFAWVPVVQFDGSIVVGGYIQAGAHQRGVIMRLTPEGVLDASFGGGDGVTAARPDGRNTNIDGIAVGRLADIIGMGATQAEGQQSLMGVLRLTPQGIPDPRFNGDGQVVVDGPTGGLDAATVQANGNVIGAGGALVDGQWIPVLVRICGNVFSSRQQPAPTGSAASDDLYGTCQGDTIDGHGGNDAIVGGLGNDRLKGGAGNDRLRGGRGRDTLLGGSGTDLLTGGNGADHLFGGSGRDRLVGGSGPDILMGGPGPDAIEAVDRARDVIDCGPGRDSVRADPLDVLRHCEHVTRVRG